MKLSFIRKDGRERCHAPPTFARGEAVFRAQRVARNRDVLGRMPEDTGAAPQPWLTDLVAATQARYGETPLIDQRFFSPASPFFGHRNQRFLLWSQVRMAWMCSALRSSGSQCPAGILVTVRSAQAARIGSPWRFPVMLQN